MPDADSYSQLVARYGEETVAAAVLARWSLDPEADDRWAALMGDVERDGFERVCPSCNRIRSVRDFHWDGIDQIVCGDCSTWGVF